MYGPLLPPLPVRFDFRENYLSGHANRRSAPVHRRRVPGGRGLARATVLD